jgi:hypothetical protein
LKGVISHPDEKDLITATVRGAIGLNGAMDNAILIDPGTLPTPKAMSAATLPLLEDSSPERTSMIVVNESFMDEGIPTRYVHHREFPEIRGEGETTTQCVLRLSHQLDRAREHARESWQKEAVEQAIQDVKAYQSSLSAESAGATASAVTDDIRGQLNQVAQTSALAVH